MTETAAELLQQLADADNKIATARGVLKQAEIEYAEVEDKVFKMMDTLGTETIRNSNVGLQATTTKTEIDAIEDWEKFTAFVSRHKLLHFFQRRITSTALKEWREANPKKTIPGIGKFTKRRLSVTKIRT